MCLAARRWPAFRLHLPVLPPWAHSWDSYIFSKNISSTTAAFGGECQSIRSAHVGMDEMVPSSAERPENAQARGRLDDGKPAVDRRLAGPRIDPISYIPDQQIYSKC